MNELMVINKDNAINVFSGDSIDSYLKAIKDDALNLVADPETKKGRDVIISKAHSISKEKVRIDKIGKELTVEMKQKVGLVDSARKKSRDFLDDLKLQVREPVTIWEQAEKDRIEEENQIMIFESDWELAIEENILFNRQKEVERKEAELAAKEAERIEKERLEREEKERIEREARIATEAKERAEREAKERIEAAERAKVEAEQRIQLEKEQAERDKQEAIERVKREEAAKVAEDKRRIEEKARQDRIVSERKARNIAHQRKVNREALEDFTKNDIDEELGKKVISLIAKKLIRNITINY